MRIPSRLVNRNSAVGSSAPIAPMPSHMGKRRANPKSLVSLSAGLALANFLRTVAKNDRPTSGLEALLVDLECLDLGLEGRRRDAEAGRRPERAGHSALAFLERGFYGVPLVSCEGAGGRGGTGGTPWLVDRTATGRRSRGCPRP